MLNNIQTLPTAATNSFGTSAHETGISFSTHLLNSNVLRSYNPETGKRRRKKSSTSVLRSELCTWMLATYIGIRKITIRDTGIYFHSHIYLHTGRVIYRKAYSLPNLISMMAEEMMAVK